jgi:hypothetical protein
VIPFNDLDIKNLKGEWQGFSRMRVGKVRVVFKVDAEADELQIYDIDFRGNVYKSLAIDRPSNSYQVASLSAALTVWAEEQHEG